MAAGICQVAPPGVPLHVRLAAAAAMRGRQQRCESRKPARLLHARLPQPSPYLTRIQTAAQWEEHAAIAKSVWSATMAQALDLPCMLAG